MNNAKDFFLDYANNYLTLERIAEHNQMTINSAKKLINEGKKDFELEFLKNVLIKAYYQLKELDYFTNICQSENVDINNIDDIREIEYIHHIKLLSLLEEMKINLK